MNGINLTSFCGNKGIFANTIFNKNMSKIYGVGVKVQEKDIVNKSKNIQISANNDTYEHNSMLIQVQNKNEEKSQGKDWVMPGRLGFAFYDETKLNTPPVFAELDSDGVSKGIQLSGEAKDFLNELKNEYKNVDFTIANLSTNAERSYYEKLSNRDKEYSVLIDARLFEEDAAGEYNEFARKALKHCLDDMFGKEGKMEREFACDTDFDTVAAWSEEQNKTKMLQRGEQVVAGKQNEIKDLYFQIDKTGEKDYVMRLLKGMVTDVENDKKTLEELQQEKMDADDK